MKPAGKLIAGVPVPVPPGLMVMMDWAMALLLKPDSTAMATYLAIWGLFTFGLFIGTFRLSFALQFVFGSLAILFFLLAYGDYYDASADFKKFTGFEGILCGFSAMYTGLAAILNELYGRTVLPLTL